jgi:hypothetical protein
MGRTLNEVIKALPSHRKKRILSRHRKLKKEIEERKLLKD